MFELPAMLLAWFYSLTSSYAVAIALIAVVVMTLVTPLTLKSTKGMLEMQKLAPEMRKLQAQYRNDRQKLNEEMMKLYQEHKVNPMASCLPLVAQMPVFIIMFRILTGLTYEPAGGNEAMAQAVLRAGGAANPDVVGFLPRYIGHETALYESLVRKTEMISLGLDLSISPAQALGEDFAQGLIYAGLVVFLGALYFFQQRMVAARASISPTMSPGQQKLMQYLPVVFAVFQIFFLLGLVIYYIVQSLLRILQQVYITKRFYGHDEALGRQAQRAGEQARELAKQDGGSGGLFGLGKGATNGDTGTAPSASRTPGTPPGATKRTTPPKSRPTPSSTGASGRPSANRPGGPPKRSKKR
jgi:YidC/Oxa1 family membrane protein insertase